VGKDEKRRRRGLRLVGGKSAVSDINDDDDDDDDDGDGDGETAAADTAEERRKGGKKEEESRISSSINTHAQPRARTRLAM